MSTLSNAVEEPIQSHSIALPVVIPPARRFYWAVRRELAESRWVWLAPAGVAALFLVGFVINAGHVWMRVGAAFSAHTHDAATGLTQAFDIAAALLMLTTMVVGAFYSVDALYGERRDRSILFWKSMPVSDNITVLAKASIPIVFVPVIAFAIAVVLQFLMLVVSSTALAAAGGNVASLWTLSFPRMSLLLLYHLVTAHGLGPAPLYAWLLMVSAWARRAPLVWAVVPPIALAFFEKVTFNTTYFAKVVLERVTGTGMEAYTMPGTFPTNPMTHLTPLRLLSSADLWISLAVTALFLVAAIQLRRRSEPV
jgi:ABC-2 type transport system permease protein